MKLPVFVSPQPHEKAAWQAEMREAFMAIKRRVDAEAAAKTPAPQQPAPKAG